MAPAKGNKPDVNPWGWIVTVACAEIGIEHMLQAYRIVGYKPCDDPRRNCKRNPKCLWGLGEKKWVQDAEEGSGDEDNGFREEGEFAGLQNLGATCYVNSLLQLWYHNPILRPAILRWQPTDFNNDSEVYRPQGPIAQLQAMFARMKMSKRSKIDPTEFVTSLKLDTGEQQDAQEFSKLFMEVIIKMLTKYTDGAVREAVANTFRGELQNETECTGCKNKTRRQESFSELELGVRKNLGESLDELLKDELLTGSDQYYCSVCNTKNDAIRRTQLLKLPPVLNLQLMRFVFDRESCRKKKVTTNIQFPEVLDMRSRIFDDEDQPNGSGEPLTYQLSAVLVHNGPSASSGHYVAQIKDLRTGIWHKFNDENVDPVGKAKSQKLVLKDDEGSGSDTEKLKLKKTKGNHSSTGAYMLVYTLERYVVQPEPDPELWPYLEELVKSEDNVYEDDVKKSKHDKEYENNLREQRKREISMIYPNLKINGQDEKCNDNEPEDMDIQPPKKKHARTEVNGICKQSAAVNGPNSNSSDDVEMEDYSHKDQPKSKRDDIKVDAKISKVYPATNMINSDNHAECTAEMLENLDFISADWMQQWLDGNNPPPPIENKALTCEHGKLKPPSPNSTVCLYKAVPSSFADELYNHYSVDGPRFKGADALCLVCVTTECNRLQKLTDLDNDYKTFVELNKKFETIVNSKDPNHQIFWELECCWIGKETARSWKRMAKVDIEKRFQLNDIVDPDAETQEDSDVSSMPLNSELLCPHNNLHPNDAIRKLISVSAWDIVSKYFPDAVKISVKDKSVCEECLNEKKDDTELRNKYKEIAFSQKTKLPDLYHGRNRPNIVSVESIFVVSLEFVNQWRKFIRDPAKCEPLKSINNKSLQCPHDKFMYPLNYLADIINDVKPEEEMLCLMHPNEWAIVKDMFSVDKEIEIKVTSTNPITLEYHPEICEPCATEWWFDTYRQKFDYVDKVIYVVRRDKDDQTEQQRSEDDDDDDLFTAIRVTGKRDRKRRDPAAWENNKFLSTMGNASTNQSTIRRSARPRHKKMEKSYKVSSAMKLKDLKLLIVKDFQAFLSDQHLFYRDEELTDDQLTLGQLQIAPGTTIYLEIDTETKDEDDPVPSSVETGFKGTLLMGNTSSQNAVADLNAELEILSNGEKLS